MGGHKPVDFRVAEICAETGVRQMAEEHEAKQPYKCAICGAKFDAQEQLQEHLKKCTEKKIDQSRAFDDCRRSVAVKQVLYFRPDMECIH